MKPQPDTSTLDGKIAVMEASKTKRIQQTQGADWKDLKPNHLFWDWVNCIYRIHPDDLNPPPEPKWRPWKPEEVPLGACLKLKAVNDTRRLIVGTGYSYVCMGGMGSFPLQSIFDNWTLEDDSPCGVRIV